ncbi:restriction endonuclease subunit S [Denitrificimonas sp. JX-1]|uniref:Restriction endonuclease subunit S n=1 Tax=Denitrificimonas halotolerans TaxID=3098930 RepID=A0ABU5GXA8_9GAMM|nr:restriction endonuclease subunit S [Denitrificimonas sp. JX-1]MDY7220288.1 restriction endonuclease subunit S [Denitrificimonas sp. JX-1]
MVPEDWSFKSLDSAKIKVVDGDRGKEYPKAGDFLETGYCLFLSAKNVTKAGFLFEELQFINEDKDKKLRKGRVERGNIVLTTRGSVGQFAYFDNSVPYDVMRINSGMVVIDPTQSELLPEFFYALCRSFIVGKQIEAASFGSAQPQLTVGIIKGIKLPIPPLPEQKKIAQILSTWDKAITTTEQLLANSQQQKKALMQQLLTGKKRLLDDNGVRFSGEWKRVELGQLLDYKQPTPYLVKSTNYSNDFKTPVLTAGKTFILGYTDETDGVYDIDFPVVIFDDFTTACKFVDFPFKAKSSALKILTAKPNVNIKYVFEAMQMLNFIIGGHQRHWISIFSNLVISLPDKKEQQKIAAVLTSADQEIESLEQKIDALKQEKKALMQQLLTGKRRVKP